MSGPRASSRSRASPSRRSTTASDRAPTRTGSRRSATGWDRPTPRPAWTAGSPGPFATRIITAGVIPSLHVPSKRCHVKQDVKDGRAVRAETTLNDAHDGGLKRGRLHVDALHQRGRRTNTRLLEAEPVAHDCG